MLIKWPQVVLLHSPNRKLRERCVHTISLASTRVPTMRIRTLRPFTIFWGSASRLYTHITGRHEFWRVRIGLELVVDGEQMRRHKDAQGPDLGEEAHFVDVGDQGVHDLAVELRVRASDVPASAQSPGICCGIPRAPCRA